MTTQTNIGQQRSGASDSQSFSLPHILFRNRLKACHFFENEAAFASKGVNNSMEKLNLVFYVELGCCGAYAPDPNSPKVC